MEQFEHFASGIVLEHAAGAFQLGTDSILASWFATLPQTAAVVDLGCGSGAIGLLLCGRSRQCRVTGVELQAAACDLANRNIVHNHLQDRAQILCGDLRQIQALLPQGAFDCVVSNPPYFPVSSGAIAKDPIRAIARTELMCTLEDVIQAAAWLLRSGGYFTLVHRPERLTDILCICRAHDIEPKRLCFVRHQPSAPCSTVLLEGRRGGKPGLTLEPELTLFDAEGQPTAHYQAIYHL